MGHDKYHALAKNYYIYPRNKEDEDMIKTRVAIVDDHKIFREGIKALFIADPGIEFVAEAGTAYEFIGLLAHVQADIALIDIALPKVSGITLAKEAREKFPSMQVIMLTSDKSEYCITGAIKAGARGYLHKDTSREEIKKAIEAVALGGEYFSQSISPSVFRSFVTNVRGAQSANGGFSLSDREIEVVKLISEGLTYKEIAARLFISARTVESHKNNIFEKLRIKSIPELVKFSIQHNYISLE